MQLLNKLTVAMSLALVAGTASADFTDPYNSGTVQSSSILFAAVDENTSSANYGATFVFDLALPGNTGLNYASFQSGSVGNLSWNLGSYSAFSAFAADSSKLQWTVLGGQAITSNSNSAANIGTWGALATLTSDGSFSTKLISLELATSTGSIANWFTVVNNALDANGPAPQNVASFAKGVVTDITDLNSLQNSGSIYANLGGVNSNSISFWEINNTNTFTRSPSNNIVTDLGTFALNGSTLTYTAVSAVPLPASTWLFLSGVLGLLGMKRRSAVSNRTI